MQVPIIAIKKKDTRPKEKEVSRLTGINYADKSD